MFGLVKLRVEDSHLHSAPQVSVPSIGGCVRIADLHPRFEMYVTMYDITTKIHLNNVGLSNSDRNPYCIIVVTRLAHGLRVRGVRGNVTEN